METVLVPAASRFLLRLENLTASPLHQLGLGPCQMRGAYWRQLENTIERSVRPWGLFTARASRLEHLTASPLHQLALDHGSDGR